MIILVASVLVFSFCETCLSKDMLKGKLIIFHAGSLAIPFEELGREFNKLHPDVIIEREAAGSRECARKIADLKRPCDIMASADYSVIESLLIPEYASWLICFATNEMAIMYTDKSRFKDEINENNWHEILLRPDVEYGRADPDIDPCGYRTLLVLKLAEEYYNIPGLYDKLIAKCPASNIRPKETDLINLLEAGEIDYLFIYRSVCEQHEMPFALMPEQVNLKTESNKDYYSKVSVEISGKKPGERIVKKGAPMIYGITIPDNAPNKDAAEAFASFVVSKKGLEIMGKNGQPPIIPPTVKGDKKAMPSKLKGYIH